MFNWYRLFDNGNDGGGNRSGLENCENAHMRILDGCNNLSGLYLWWVEEAHWRQIWEQKLTWRQEGQITWNQEFWVLQCWRRLMCSQVCDAGLGERVKIIHLGKLGSLTMSPPWVSLCVGDVQKKLTPNRQAVLPSYNMVGVWVGKVSFECFHIILMYICNSHEGKLKMTNQTI